MSHQCELHGFERIETYPEETTPIVLCAVLHVERLL